MTSVDQTINLLAQLALATDGAFAGLALAIVSVKIWRGYLYNSKALHKIRNAPTVQISDLRSLLSSSSSSSDSSSSSPSSSSSSSSSSECESCNDDGKLIVVRGLVEAKSAVEKDWRSLRANVLLSSDKLEKAAVIQRIQTCIYHEWRGLLGWSDLRSFLGRSWKDQKCTSHKTIPFVLLEEDQSQRSNYVIVNLDGSRHPIPLTTIFQHLRPAQPTPYTFLQAIFGHAYPVGLLEEEKILPLGKEITAVGVCRLKDGIPEIKSDEDLPFFLSDLTKRQIVEDLATSSGVQFWMAIVLGSLSVGVLGYAAVRNWRKYKDWRQRQQAERARQAALAETAAVVATEEPQFNEEVGEVPEGETCAVCLTRRRRSAFVPCGHLVCCPVCALAVERELQPKCPVCRQQITTSVRIYDS